MNVEQFIKTINKIESDLANQDQNELENRIASDGYCGILEDYDELMNEYDRLLAIDVKIANSMLDLAIYGIQSNF